MKKIFIRGLIALTPIALTIALVSWLFGILESTFSVPIKELIGSKYYFKGLGIVVALIFIFIVGIAVNNWLIKKIYNWGEQILIRIPLIKTIYTSICDLLNFFQVEKDLKHGKVVSFELMGMRIVGLVTRENFADMPEGIAEGEEVTVFIPFGYQIGGYTVMVPRSKLRVIDMSVEDGMRFAITAGMLGRKNNGARAFSK